MAEREGFEPSLGLTLNTLSRRAPSATQPPLQIFYYRIKTSLGLTLNTISGVCPAGAKLSPLSHLSKFLANQSR